MPAHSKGLTSSFLLRMDPSERSLIEGVVAEYGLFDIKISLNDAARLLIRRGAAPCPPNEAAAKSAILAHWSECDGCDAQRIGCPEGRRLKTAYDQMVPLLTRGPTRLLPPPPGVKRKN